MLVVEREITITQQQKINVPCAFKDVFGFVQIVTENKLINIGPTGTIGISERKSEFFDKNVSNAVKGMPISMPEALHQYENTLAAHKLIAQQLKHVI